MTKKTD